MVDQYIYTKVERRGWGVRHGLIGRTEGVVGAVQKNVQKLAGLECSARDRTGVYMPVWSKLNLPERPDKVVLQRSVRRVTAEEKRLLTHGYVVSRNDPILENPELWGGLAFCDPEQAEGYLLRRLETLNVQAGESCAFGDVLAFFQLTPDTFVSLVCSCFSAAAHRGMTLVAMDGNSAHAQEMSLQLLQWLYRFLPPALRRQLNVTGNVDDGNSVYGLVGLVPEGDLSASDGKLMLRRRRLTAPGGIALFARGRVLTGGAMRSGKTESGPYRRWIRRIAGWLAEAAPAEGARAVQGMGKVYRRMDEMIRGLPVEERCRERYYDALCWSRMMFRTESGARVPNRDDLPYFDDLLSFGSWPEVIRSVGRMLHTMERLYTTPASTRLIRLMTKMILLDGVDEELERVKELLCAFLSKDMETVGSGDSSSVSVRYFRIMEESGAGRMDALELLERSFFPKAFLGGAWGRMDRLWERVGTSRTPQEGWRRCGDWVGGYVNVCMSTEELIQCADTVIREVDGFQPELLAEVLDCLLAVQATRTYYAKLEILPGHLTQCIQCIGAVKSMVRRDYYEIVERYYTKLLNQLCREYINVRRGLCTLTSACEVLEEAERERWSRDFIRCADEVIELHGASLRGYSWEVLKRQLSGEGDAILRRLWKVLEYGRVRGLDREAGEILCGQVCRYLLHALPDYVDEEWIRTQVQERPGLTGNGYYRELLAVRDFAESETRSLEELRRCLDRQGLTREAARDVMKTVYRLFARGGLNGMEPAAVQGAYVGAQPRIRTEQWEVLREILRRTGGGALLEVLAMWPSAPAAFTRNESRRAQMERQRRPGAYPWLENTEHLAEALLRLTEETELLEQTERAEPGFLLKLAEEADALFPVGTVGRAAEVQMARRLLEQWTAIHGRKGHLRMGQKRRRLLAE